jgi:hypothetical protein
MMMFNQRLTRTAAVALAIAATAVPTASAQPIDDGPIYRAQPANPAPTAERTRDLRSPDARDAALHRGLYEPMRPEDQPQPAQDLRNPDTRDYADGRGTYSAPDDVVVKTRTPVADPTTADGIDWQDVGIGAAGLLGAVLIALGGTLLVVQRRGARTRVAH